MTNTLTALLPCWSAYEPVDVAFIFFLSHCSDPSGSGIACASEPVGEYVPPLSVALSMPTSSVTGPVETVVATSAALTEVFATIAAAKLGFEETTAMPPICGIRVTMEPPAAATSWSTLPGRLCCLKATTNVCGDDDAAVPAPAAATVNT